MFPKIFQYANENESEANKRHLQYIVEVLTWPKLRIQQSGNQFS